MAHIVASEKVLLGIPSRFSITFDVAPTLLYMRGPEGTLRREGKKFVLLEKPEISISFNVKERYQFKFLVHYNKTEIKSFSYDPDGSRFYGIRFQDNLLLIDDIKSSETVAFFMGFSRRKPSCDMTLRAPSPSKTTQKNLPDGTSLSFIWTRLGTGFLISSFDGEPIHIEFLRPEEDISWFISNATFDDEGILWAFYSSQEASYIYRLDTKDTFYKYIPNNIEPFIILQEKISYFIGAWGNYLWFVESPTTGKIIIVDKNSTHTREVIGVANNVFIEGGVQISPFGIETFDNYRFAYLMSEEKKGFQVHLLRYRDFARAPPESQRLMLTLAMLARRLLGRRLPRELMDYIWGLTYNHHLTI